MKKASKKDPRTPKYSADDKSALKGSIPSQSDSVAAFALENPYTEFVWIELVPELRCSDSELDCVREVIRNHVELRVIQISSWRLGVSEVVKRLKELGNQGKHHLYVVSGNRSDAIAAFAGELHNVLPESKCQFILGQWWSGHKRTAPLLESYLLESYLLESCRTYYWYELYDGLLEDFGVVASPPSLSEMALVVSGNPDLRKMWSELLPKDAIQVVSLMDTSRLPVATFRYVVVDGDTSGDCASLVARLRGRYPQATLAVAWGFPEWDKTRQALVAGADIFVGKPFRWDNFLNCLRNHPGHA